MRKTKIVCTIGPATDDENIMRELMLAGMNVARFNFFPRRLRYSRKTSASDRASQKGTGSSDSHYT